MGTKEFENKIIMATSEKHWTNQDFQDMKKYFQAAFHFENTRMP